jgi:hypothetical protein
VQPAFEIAGNVLQFFHTPAQASPLPVEMFYKRSNIGANAEKPPNRLLFCLCADSEFAWRIADLKHDQIYT